MASSYTHTDVPGAGPMRNLAGFGSGSFASDESSEDYGVLQELVDLAFCAQTARVDRMTLITQAEIHDVGADVLEVVELLPPGSYARGQLTDQMNSIISGHGWSQRLGLVE